MTTAGPPVALVTYSTRPRGGVAHTLALGEALHRLGHPVLIVGLGDPEAGFFREVGAPTLIAPAPQQISPAAGQTALEAKVDACIDTLQHALAEVGTEYPILHTQDCISARAAARVRDGATGAGAGIRAGVSVLRTVHHVDDFDTAKLMDCQRRAILEPDRVLVVSRQWQRILADEYGVFADRVSNGVDVDRYTAADPALVASLRARVAVADRGGADGRRELILGVGGIEPRKGTDHLVAALGLLKRTRAEPPVLAIIGGHSFQDHRWYREQVLESLASHDIELGRDLVELGPVPESEMAAWYAAADVLAFPSVKEGFGLAALEAMCAGTPVVTSDLPVFREWIDDEALLVEVGDVPALGAALASVLDDEPLRHKLIHAGRRLAARYTWESTARAHQELYRQVPVGAGSAPAR